MRTEASALPGSKGLPVGGSPPPVQPKPYNYQQPAIQWPATPPTLPPPPAGGHGDQWWSDPPTPPAEAQALQNYASVLQQAHYTPAAQQYLASIPLNYTPTRPDNASGEFVAQRGQPGSMWLTSMSDPATAQHELAHAWDWKNDLTDIDPLLARWHQLTGLFGDRQANFAADANLMQPQFPASMQAFPGMFGNAQPSWGGASEFYATAGEQPPFIPSGLRQYYTQYDPAAYQ